MEIERLTAFKSFENPSPVIFMRLPAPHLQRHRAGSPRAPSHPELPSNIHTGLYAKEGALLLAERIRFGTMQS